MRPRRQIAVVRILAFPYPMLLLAIWTGVLVAGDCVVLETSVHQFRSGRYARTVGEVTRSDLGRSAMRRRGIDIVYSYSVGGTGYIGNQYRYDESNGALDYRAITNAFQRGSRTTVYYDPSNPGDSVLSPGLNGCDLLLMLFALPLNILTAALWVVSVHARWGPSRSALAGGVRVFRRPGETCVRLSALSPFGAGFFGVAAAAGTVSMLVVFMRGFDPTIQFMFGGLMVVAATGVAVALWTARRQQSGQHDLRIREEAQTVLLPPAGERQEALLIPKGEIVAVSMYRRITHSPSGQHFTYVPALERAAFNAQPEALHLISWGWTEKKARAFGNWLSQQLGVHFRPMY